ncbi:cytochrome C oxidase subunit III [Mycobacteroides abscessus subsp. abscessus]|uniref:cytochrome c oxidase subunit 3 n=1 Tax=Mycobacteroides abscessus TaxID=36809 RepID=UPI00092BD554|nr:cytochrome c oxidase subunit 3 [Mycobacteroides abscessus]SHU55321.1 cytochrome C oxidase subunit III [Mycobacteroides abscessus subsp. abscessus]SHX65286.1 cytochrome C oxidase subunit III [Mycobacteroides abscessus subsp. abscessus]SIG92902.1 cytochrome C oxidase subunit III [Mycobacteroides abscessus subsp. abscessus]SKD19032.1 cytochrome C oxidase subunit III [Mycobacteroides abscessus subsp. abscessus]SKM54606.1 cytochrome C oxidase subunit III [Mycobacteroides abscessus subsp. abscess
MISSSIGVNTKGHKPRIPGEEGIWVFVLGDMVVFALFFGTFMYSRGRNPGIFAQGHGALLISLGTINTLLLLSSSLLVALGVSYVRGMSHPKAKALFTGAMLCGIGFAILKVVEWARLLAEGLSVGTSEYFSYYFMFTGIHLGHVLIGLVVLGRLTAAVRRPVLDAKAQRFCETGGIFWHMVDLLWIVLFALFYLVR